jgi:hypothetical protein
MRSFSDTSPQTPPKCCSFQGSALERTASEALPPNPVDTYRFRIWDTAGRACETVGYEAEPRKHLLEFSEKSPFSRRFWILIGLSFTLILSANSSWGQQSFQLHAPGIQTPSFAIVHPSGMLLIRDASKQETIYRRDEKFDSGDALWIGYYSSQARQALQWPASNRGAMRIGSLDNSNQWSFRTSRMTIQTQSPPSSRDEVLPDNSQLNANLGIDSNINRLSGNGPTADGIRAGGFGGSGIRAGGFGAGSGFVLPMDPNQAPVPIQLGMGDPSRRRFLARNSYGTLGVVPQTALGNQSWYIVPLANGLARIQYYDNQTWLGLGCAANSQILTLSAVSGNVNQLWRVNASPGNMGAYTFESIMYPGLGLSFIGNGLQLAPINYSSYQQWWPVAPQLPVVQPLYRSVSQNVVSNPPLEPARVVLQNTHSDTIIVLLADLRGGGGSKKIRIPSGASETVSLDRDSGATIVETFEVRSLSGFWERSESRIAVPPASLYDVSVYEVFLQSIAIDRTGSSPNPIEDVNYQPRSIGLFVIPPGNQMANNGVLDVYRTANAARNPGSVRRLQQEDHEKPNASAPVDPLKAILKEFEGKRAAF